MFTFFFFVVAIAFVIMWAYDYSETLKVYSYKNLDIQEAPIFKHLIVMLGLILGFVFTAVFVPKGLMIGQNNVLIIGSSVILSALTAQLWFRLIDKLDVFEPENKIHLLAAFVAGAICSVLIWPYTSWYVSVYEANFYYGNTIHDLFVAWTRVGIIQEVIKILPLIVIWRFTKIINEPFDFILFAALSSLGFSAVENFFFLSDSKLMAMAGQAFTSSPFNLVLTSYIGYCLAMAIYKKQNPWFALFQALFLTSIVHALYEYWVDESFLLKLLSLALLLLLLKAWLTMVNNSLNVSKYFEQKQFNSNQYKYWFATTATVVILVGFLLSILIHGVEISLDVYMQSAFFYMILMAFISLNFGRLKLIPGYIAPYFNFEDNFWHQVSPLVGSTGDATGTELQLYFSKKMHKNKMGVQLASQMPIKGKVLHRAIYDGDDSFYVIMLDKPVEFGTNKEQVFLISSLSNDVEMCSPKASMIEFYGIKKWNPNESGVFRRKYVRYLHDLRCRGVIEA